MSIVEPRLLKRYLEIARLIVRHGGSDWLSPDASRELRSQGVAVDESAGDSALADDLEAMGPTFVKLGQLLSTRPDLVPARYIDGLARLRNDVEPFASEDAVRIVREELGAKPTSLFAHFEEEPFAAASLSQVHRARMRDGRDVVVKIQRPEIRERMTDDLDALARIAELLESHSETARCMGLTEVVEQFRRTLMLELDFRHERANLDYIAGLTDAYSHLTSPEAVGDFCAERVLTMSRIEGTALHCLSPLALTEIDGPTLARELFDAYLEQVLVNGCFHADPHSGNLLLTPGGRIGIIDLGMVGRLAPSARRELLKLLLAIAEGDGSRACRVSVRLGTPTPKFNPARYEQQIAELVARHTGARLGELNVGGILIQICRVATDCRLRLPPELALLGKTLLNLDEIGTTLDPQFDPHAAVRENAARLMHRRAGHESLPGKVYSTLLDTQELAEKLPRQLSRLLDHAADNDLRFRVDAFDQPALIGSLRKIANRVTAGLVLAALIVGAALMMRVETDFTVLGYPGIAMLLFLAAAAGGSWLALQVLRDREPPARPPR